MDGVYWGIVGGTESDALIGGVKKGTVQPMLGCTYDEKTFKA